MITSSDIEAAAEALRGQIRETPVWPLRVPSPGPDHEVLLKCEHLQLTGSFKVRGALNFVRQLSPDDARRGLVAMSAGNHAQGVALAASLRGIARRAGVDSALVHHYFAGKPALFAEVMTVPVDPAYLVNAVIGQPRERVGEALVATFLGIWDSPEGQERFAALARSVLTHEEAARMLREFLVREVFAKVAVAHNPGLDPATAELRATLAAGQLLGIAMLRYLLRFPALRRATVPELIAEVGPVIQRYLAPDA